MGKGLCLTWVSLPWFDCKRNLKYITVPVLFVVCKISWLWEFYFSIRTFYISIWPNRIQTFIPYYAYRNVADLNLTLDMARTGCTKTYVRLSRTGRNLVQTCKPLAWLVCGTSSFLIRKNTGTVENWLQIKVEFKFNMLLVIKARFKWRTIIVLPLNLALALVNYLQGL